MPRTNGEIGASFHVNKIAKYCVGLTFVAGLSAFFVYLIHGWTWNSQFAGGRITLTLPEFVILVVLVTLVLGICIDSIRAMSERKP